MPNCWPVVGPSAVPYGGHRVFPVHEMTRDEIKAVHRAYADAARRAVDVCEPLSKG